MPSVIKVALKLCLTYLERAQPRAKDRKTMFLWSSILVRTDKGRAVATDFGGRGKSKQLRKKAKSFCHIDTKSRPLYLQKQRKNEKAGYILCILCSSFSFFASVFRHQSLHLEKVRHAKYCLNYHKAKKISKIAHLMIVRK